jgi:hypothetical protein
MSTTQSERPYLKMFITTFIRELSNLNIILKNKYLL